ncbi:MAG: hypothetical protein SF069_00570 [Phycisphaerae bacterium]|nr:hypothetical protein [Phycisphaerae bacterium]
MDSFRWITTVLSMILGLGVTRLLSSVIAMFRSRAHSRLDWIPLVWAGCIFVWQLQFWWAIIELPGLVKVWTLGYFLTLVTLTLLLFVAAALVLPPGELAGHESMTAAFERDGRWSLVALSGYFVLALVADWVFWGVTPFSVWGALLALLIGLPPAYLAMKTRAAQATITILYVPLSIGAAIALSPAKYS